MDCWIPTIELEVGVELFYLGKSQTPRFHHAYSHKKLRGEIITQMRKYTMITGSLTLAISSDYIISAHLQSVS
jgi:hypothetical protein